jgi:hypothetical protein
VERACSVLIVEVDEAAQLVLLVAELGGDGLALLERLTDAALLLEQHPLGALRVLPVQVLLPLPLQPPKHLGCLLLSTLSWAAKTRKTLFDPCGGDKP